MAARPITYAHADEVKELDFTHRDRRYFNHGAAYLRDGGIEEQDEPTRTPNASRSPRKGA